MEQINSGLLPEGVEGIDRLEELALDLRNCWEHGADEIWKNLDEELWSRTHNPWVVLQTASRSRLRRVLGDPRFRAQVERRVTHRRERSEASTWFTREHPGSPLSCVAYFSMEFGLSESLPIYSGGLGNVAGDQLKAADDLGVPMIGVGLLYQRGYFRQFIDANGRQTDLYPYNDPGQLPITPVRDKDGEWFRLPVVLPGLKLWLRAWQAKVGRLTLFLLDSNDPANLPVYRGIVSELYGGGPELRLQQEMVLGIGGWRLLRGLGFSPEVCHLNEGHAAFAVLERARGFMEDFKQSFAVALEATRAGNLFTTHTPVAAGIDRFSPEIMNRYLAHYAEVTLGIGMHDLMALGRANPDDDTEPFNMAYLAIRGSGAVNAVSRLHAEVSRAIFAPLFQRWPEHEIPIGSVTNGVHTPTWDSTSADNLWTKCCGPDRWREPLGEMTAQISCLADSAIWEMRTENRNELVQYIRSRLVSQVAASRDEDPSWAETVFDPNCLTMGFARRFATYKRPNLLLRDPERLARILTNPERPVQLVVAGKAHPLDEAGKAMIEQWVHFVRRPELRGHVVFLSDYDLILAEYLVRGVDLWINTPRRPWEACGTSGMKVLVNGGLNLSELDGWWAEAYSPEVGWALGDGRYHNDDPAWDGAEAEQLYTMIEREVVPCFYNRDPSGIPTAWVSKVRNSMSMLTPMFSANRSVREYTDDFYLPAALAYQKRAANSGAPAAELLRWQTEVRKHWPSIHFGNLEVTTENGLHRFRVPVYLDDLDPGSVQVELYADPSGASQPARIAMRRGDPLVGAVRAWTYVAELSADRPAADYTARIVPAHPGALVPLEANQIKWQR
jgi:glycogen phosphorylase